MIFRIILYQLKNIKTMKRTVKITLTILLILFTAGSVAISQDKKDTKKLKVIVENEDGTKVIIDTTFSSIIKTDTIATGDGNFIFVTTKDGKAIWTVKEGKDLSVISEESLELLKEGEEGKVVVIKSGNKDKEGEENNLMAWAIGNVVYISEDGPEFIKEGAKSYSIVVKTDDTGGSSDKTNYVIAKDGMVITIEGDDYAKVQQIGKLIESQLSIEKDKK